LVGREWFETRLRKSNRSEKAIYDVFMEATLAVAGCGGKDEWFLGDKTPGHLYHIDTILKWYPNAKIIHTFRDPRAIAVSEWRRICRVRSWRSEDSIQGLIAAAMATVYVAITWRYAAKLHYKYQKQYPENYMLVSYERLVQKPGGAVKELCDFIGMPFNEKMLQPHRQGSSYDSYANDGFDAAGVDRWRQYIKRPMYGFLTRITQPALSEFGYDE